MRLGTGCSFLLKMTLQKVDKRLGCGSRKPQERDVSSPASLIQYNLPLVTTGLCFCVVNIGIQAILFHQKSDCCFMQLKQHELFLHI